MEKQPLISVVMPTYNCVQYIRESVDSILAQTYKNFEFIIVDGHSTDGTEKILEDYSNKDDRIIILHDNKEGIGAAIKLGCEKAKGEYIARMDSDDISLPQRLSVEIKNLLSASENTILISCSAIYIDKNGNFLGYSFPYTLQCLLRTNVQSVLHPGVLMKKDAYLKVGGYPPLVRTEDYFLWSRMIKLGRLKILQYPLIKYRISPETLTNSMSDYFNSNFRSYYKQFIFKEAVTDHDYAAINKYIKAEIIKSNTFSRYPVRHFENRIFNILNCLFSEYIAFKSVFMFKNIYGICRYALRG